MTEEDIDSDSSVIKDNRKKAINIVKVKSTMMEGPVPDFTDKTFCNIFNMPTRNEVTADNLLNEMIADKRKGGKEFLLRTLLSLEEKTPLHRCFCGR